MPEGSGRGEVFQAGAHTRSDQVIAESPRDRSDRLRRRGLTLDDIGGRRQDRRPLWWRQDVRDGGQRGLRLLHGALQSSVSRCGHSWPTAHEHAHHEPTHRQQREPGAYRPVQVGRVGARWGCNIVARHDRPGLLGLLLPLQGGQAVELPRAVVVGLAVRADDLPVVGNPVVGNAGAWGNGPPAVRIRYVRPMHQSVA